MTRALLKFAQYLFFGLIAWALLILCASCFVSGSVRERVIEFKQDVQFAKEFREWKTKRNK